MTIISTIERFGLRVSFQKTEVATFVGGRTEFPVGSISVGGERVPVGRSIKYLGIILDRSDVQGSFPVDPSESGVSLQMALSRIMPK